MTCERLCGPQRQPCPSPWVCRIDCNFQCAEVEAAYTEAARHFWEPEQPLHIVDCGRPIHIRAWDWLGNLPHRFGRWVDRSPVLQMAGFAVGAVVACALAALVVMR